MTRTTFAAVLPLLTVLALTLPGEAIAGPPEGVSGKMVLDEVAEGLRRFRRDEDWIKRLRLLERLAPTQDPRVAVLLGELTEQHIKEADEKHEFSAVGMRSVALL